MLRAVGGGYGQPMERNAKPEDLNGYLTDRQTDEAIQFMEAERDRPFFLYVAYNAPHTPMQAPEELLEKFSGIQDEKRRRYAAMVHSLDLGVGRLLESLDASGLREKTVVFFLSDNGGPSFANASRNAPLRGDKGEIWEGGIRVPFLVSWPGQVPGGEVVEYPVISLDVSRTALELSGAKLTDNLDGVNLIPFLRDGATDDPPHEALFWRMDDGTDWAVRSGRWKLLQREGGEKPELYDLETDIGETKDQVASSPEVVERLQALYSAWNAKNPKPLFSGYSQYGKRKEEFYRDLPFERSDWVHPREAKKPGK